MDNQSPWEAIRNLDLTDKESIVDLLMWIQNGWISRRRGADEIRKAFKKQTKKGKK